MRKVSLLFALAVISFSTFAQYNGEIVKRDNNASCVKSRVEVPKYHAVGNEIKAPGDILWAEDFSGGLPAGWTLEDNGVGGFEFNDGDTAYTGAWVTAESAMINSLTHANGYMHLPADYYNCKPGWPREMVASPQNIDAFMETAALDVSDPKFANGVILKFDAWWRLCCSETNTKLEVSVAWKAGEWHTFNGREYRSKVVAINDYPDGDNVVTPQYDITALIDSARGDNGGDTIRIQFRMQGGSHYFWSIDDIRMMEILENEVAIYSTYNTLGGMHMLSEKYSDGSEGVYEDYNTHYSEVPARIQNFMTLGAYLHQAGKSGVNTHVEFAVDSAGAGNVWTGNSVASDGSYAAIANYTTSTGDTIMASDASNSYENAPFFHNPELDKTWFESNSYLEDGIPYTISYQAKSDNDDAVPTDNFDTARFTQTYDRYSYHYRPNTGASYNSTEGIFNYVHQDGSSYQGTDGVDVYANVFELYYDETAQEAVKFKGVRFFMPERDSREKYVTFDGDGNNVTIVPVVFWYDPAGGSDGNGGYVEMEDLSIEGGDPYTINAATDENNYVYLNFDAGDVAATDFPQGEYLVGFKVLSYNGQKIVMAVDRTTSQAPSHFRIRSGDASDATVFYMWSPGGNAMIDAYVTGGKPLGISEVSKAANAVSIYPNPTTGILKVKNADNSTIKVYSIAGNLVKTIDSRSTMTTVDLSELSKGTYLVKVIKENEVVTKKVTLLK